MASLLYDSITRDMIAGNVSFGSDTFKAMLVTSSYSASKAHSKRSDVTSEVSGTGYSSGGVTVTATIGSTDTVNHRTDVTFANPSWATASITARGAVIYKSRGGASSADELVGFVDFGSDITSTNSTFTASLTSPFRIQN